MRNERQARYHLDSRDGAIDIAVNKKFVPDLKAVNNKQVDHLKGSLEIPYEFIPFSSEREWGFGPFLTEVESPNPKYAVYRCELPEIYDNNNYNHERTVAASVSVGIIFDAIHLSSNISDDENPQLMTIQMMNLNRTLWGSPIGATLSRPLVEWLVKKYDQTSEDNIQSAMTDAFIRMSNTMDIDLNHFQAREIRVEKNPPKWLHLAVPGNACGLDPEWSGFEDDYSEYELTPHNTDSPFQQLTLLAGLARLDYLASEGYALKDPNQMEAGL